MTGVKKCLLAAGLIIMCSICWAQKAEKEISLSLKPGGRSDRLSWSDMIESVRYVRVDDSVLLGNIQDIKYADGYFYLLDRSTVGVVVVDGNGHLVADISGRGRANNEFVSIMAFDVDPANGDVHILDAASSKIVVYTREGKYLRTVPLNNMYSSFRDIAVTTKGTYLLYLPTWTKEKSRAALDELDGKGKKIRTLVKNTDSYKWSTIMGQSRYFSRLSDGSITLAGREDRDLFFRLDPSGVFTVPYHVSVDVKVPNSVKRSWKPTPEIMKNHDYYYKLIYHETDHWLIFFMVYQQVVKCCYYDKRVDKLYVVKSPADIADPDGYGLNGFLRGCGPYLLTILADPDTPAYKRAAKEVGKTDNPIIAVVTTK